MSGLWASGPSRRRSVGDTTKDRRPRLKALAAESAQERRRLEFISTQKRARRNLSDHARLLATLPSEELDVADADEQQEQQKQRQQPQHLGYGSLTAGDVAGEALPSSGRGRDGGGGAGAREGDGMAIDEGQPADDAQGPVVGVDGASGETGVNEAAVSVGHTASKNAAGGGGYGNRKGDSQAGGRGGSRGAKQRTTNRRDHWVNQFCTPEWMLTVPNDLNGAGSTVGAGWYVMARPEGKRTLVISANGETVARQMSGAITHRFSSNLPGGSKTGRRGGCRGDGYCILDCVFHELDQTFFVLDMMAWKGYPLYDCTADFRFYWVRTKLLEADGPLDTVSSRNAYRIKPTPYHECDRQGLAHAYSSPVPFIKDGLLFHLKAAHYQLGPTPLVLMWKDSSVSRYLGVDSAQAVVLKVGDSIDYEGGSSNRGGNPLPTARHTSSPMFGGTENGGRRYPLLTADGIWVGEAGPEGGEGHVPQAKPNELLRFTLTGAEEDLLDHSREGSSEVAEAGGAGGAGGAAGLMRGVVHGLRFQKRCSKLRPMADTWSKVLFQARLRRRGGVSIDDIDARASSVARTITPTIHSAGEDWQEERPTGVVGIGGGSNSDRNDRRQEIEEGGSMLYDDDDGGDDDGML